MAVIMGLGLFFYILLWGLGTRDFLHWFARVYGRSIAGSGELREALFSRNHAAPAIERDHVSLLGIVFHHEHGIILDYKHNSNIHRGFRQP